MAYINISVHIDLDSVGLGFISLTPSMKLNLFTIELSHLNC